MTSVRHMAGSPARQGPRHILDCEERRDRNPRRRQPSEGSDVSMQVRLVGITAPRRHRRRALASGEPVSGLVEADEPGGALETGRPSP